MVFVKVRETYDLHTTRNKMTVIGIHTPKPDIIKRNYPGLLMQCKAYRPVSADVRIACASLQSLDPLQIGTASTDIAPEDVFNPILYKAMSNKGMSQLEARINYLSGATHATSPDVAGNTAAVDVNSVTSESDEFNIYYGLLANTHDWKHAAPQAGLSMTGLKPLVYEMVYNVGDMGKSPMIAGADNGVDFLPKAPQGDGYMQALPVHGVLGNAKEFPYLNCTSYSLTGSGSKADSGYAGSGFPDSPINAEVDVPYLKVVCGCIIVPPSRLHELFYRMVVEWTIEFTQIRSVSEIVNWWALGNVGQNTHFQNYDYSQTKEAITGSKDSIMDSDSCMVSANVEVTKVM